MSEESLSSTISVTKHFKVGHSCGSLWVAWRLTGHGTDGAGSLSCGWAGSGGSGALYRTATLPVAVQAVTTPSMALQRTSHPIVSLDQVIAAMFETVKDTNSSYRETLRGGLAVQIRLA